ncbi:ATP-binding protein [Streptomyces sp. NPDC058603]|uniref:ATP-binding protein n=1 Tax=Streptomyces sp. NPDC058603 TaxID=3346551 RepID=UPI0036578F41
MTRVRLLDGVTARPTAWVGRQAPWDGQSSRGDTCRIVPDDARRTSRNETLRTSLSLDRADHSCRRARQWTRATLADWSCPAGDEIAGTAAGTAAEVTSEIADDVLLVMSELVTNAVLHARGPIRAHLERRPDGSVHVAVDDGGPAASSRPHELAGDHGRGLEVIAALAADHGRTTALPCPYRARSWATVTTGDRRSPRQEPPMSALSRSLSDEGASLPGPAHAVTPGPGPAPVAVRGGTTCPPARPARTAASGVARLAVTVTETRHLVIEDPGLLMHRAWQIARCDPEAAAELGYGEPYIMNERQAFTLVLADCGGDGLDERAEQMGLRVVSTATVATCTDSDSLVYEDERLFEQR